MTNDYKKWTALQPGDIVDIVAPARGGTPEELEMAVKFLEHWKLVPRMPADMIRPHALCSNTDEYRLMHLKEALRAKDSKAVWCLRGGYGSARLFPMLDVVRPPRKAKLFIGFSDITSLHIFLQQKWKWATLHGEVLSQLGKGVVDKRSVELLRAVVFGASPKVVFPNLEPLNSAAERDVSLYSSIIGGNLSIIQTTIGTPWKIKTAGNIVFMEDVGERGYSVDRMLVHFTQAGLFDDAKAVLFGDFTEGEEKDGVSLNETVMRQFAERMSIPVLRCNGVGHDKVNNPLPLGTQAILKLGVRPNLTCSAGFEEHV